MQRQFFFHFKAMDGDMRVFREISQKQLSAGFAFRLQVPNWIGNLHKKSAAAYPRQTAAYPRQTAEYIRGRLRQIRGRLRHIRNRFFQFQINKRSSGWMGKLHKNNYIRLQAAGSKLTMADRFLYPEARSSVTTVVLPPLADLPEQRLPLHGSLLTTMSVGWLVGWLV